MRALASRGRRGSALILVLIMTLSLAGLAISAIFLSSSAGLLTRYYDRERDYRFAAEAALALGKSRVTRDTLLALPSDTAMALISGGSITDAAGNAIPRIKVNLYSAFSGDTTNRYGQYVTLLAQAYDSTGTRNVRRLDLVPESFSRFAMFVDSFPSTLAYGVGELIRGRAHSNDHWYSEAALPGPDYYDTVSAVGTINGSANYHNVPTKTGVSTIAWPTTTSLAALPGYASAANLSFAPVSVAGVSVLGGPNNDSDLSGRPRDGLLNTDPVATAVRSGSRVHFKPVDVNNDGTIQEDEGMMMIFDLATNIDTSSLRADLPRFASSPFPYYKYSIVLLNQCGLMVTIGGRKEFFPVGRFREAWVANRVRSSTAPVITAADSTTMVRGDSVAFSKILSYGPGFSRCFPAGSPYLMLSERLIKSDCTIDFASTTYGWGGQSTSCASQRYGGQDTTFTSNVRRCYFNQAAGAPGSGACFGTNSSIPLGTWRAWPGAALPAISSSVIQAVEKPYLWPLYGQYNTSSKGVIHATSGPVFMSGTVRGNLTFYVLGNVGFIDDLVYDKSPFDIDNICRNFLGIIASGRIMIADAAMNRPRPDPLPTYRFLGPDMNFELNAATMSLTLTVGVENPNGNQLAGATCAGFSQSGGCINQTGGVTQKVISATYSGTAGLREARAVDPCQLTNRKPPYFPMTGRYVDYKYYEIDPTTATTWTQVKALYSRLRGRPVP